MPQVQLMHPGELSVADLAAWRAMQAQSPAFASPLLGPDFAQMVGDVRDDARIAVWRRDGDAIGFLPHHRRPTGFARAIGAPFADYHALVSTPDANLSGGEALASAKLTALRLSGLVDPYGVFANAAPVRAPTYTIDLTGTGGDYLRGLHAHSANRAKNYRRYHRKLEADVGDLILIAPDRERDAFEQLLAWKRLQLARTGMHDFLRPDWTQTLLHDVFDRRAGSFQGLMISLYAGGRLIAAHFGARLDGVYHPWIGAMDPELEAYSPGFVHQWMAIEAMTPLALQTYDLGPGSDHWKKMFATSHADVGVGLATAPGFGGRLAGAAEGVWTVPPLAGARLAERARHRLDQIASLELTLGGRVRGVVDAVSGFERRTSSRRPSPSAS